ncbi:MAG: cytochrome d ubiquinol oxidase subunit II, partial [Candidatus Zixiibacteriota bacterium]
MAPELILFGILLLGLNIYALFGGADFGAGIWELNTAIRASTKERDFLYGAIGPVWEANHVWLIFAVVILFTAFPGAFADMSIALWLPLLLALTNIVFRGAAFAFRSNTFGSQHTQGLWDTVFAFSSTAAPLFLGAAAGAIASGKLNPPTTG